MTPYPTERGGRHRESEQVENLLYDSRMGARRAAKVRSSVGRVVAGIRFQSARTKEGVRSGQQECAAEIVKRQVSLQGMTLTNQRLRR